MDPHTAVAKVVADRVRPRDLPLLLCSTAHHAKFPAYVLKSLGRAPSPSDHPLQCLDDLEKVSSRPGPHRQLRAGLDKPRLHRRLLAASREDIVREIRNVVSTAIPS